MQYRVDQKDFARAETVQFPRPRPRQSSRPRGLAVVATATVLWVSLLSAAPVLGEVVNRVLLRVNDRIITLYDYQLALAERRSQILRSETDPVEQASQLEEAPSQVMRSLFDRLLIFSRADQLGLTVSDLEVDEAVEFQLEQNGIEDEEQLRVALMQSGMTMAMFRSQLADRLLWERVTSRELLQRIQVSDEKLREVYEQQKERFQVPEERLLREIVVLESSDLDPAEQKALAERLRSDWLAGAQPEELVDPDGSGSTFIDIGWVARGDLNPDLAAAAFALDPGEISTPIESRGGLHVVQSLETKEASVRPLEEVRDQLLRFERARGYEKELDSYLAELEERSYFRSNLPPELKDFQTKSGRAVREDALQIFSQPSSEDSDTPDPEANRASG